VATGNQLLETHSLNPNLNPEPYTLNPEPSYLTPEAPLLNPKP